MRPRVGVAVSAVVLLLAVPRLLDAATCPGIRACVPSKGCGPAAIVIGPGASIQGTINGMPATGGEICVLPGTYLGKIDFQGKPIKLVSQAGPNATILKGSGSPSGPVVTFKTFEGADSVLDGFGIQGGSALFGGGIYVLNASPTIKNCIVSGNLATGNQYSRGGGAWIAGASSRPSITCTEFTNNRADYGGGGLASAGSADPYLRRDWFRSNTAQFGGGIAVHSNGRLDLGTSEVNGNTASIDGGGIHSGTTYGNVLVRACWVHGNVATKKGGGIFVPSGLAQVMNSTFDNNRANIGGGGASSSGGLLDVAGTLFVHNTTTSGSSAALAPAAPAGLGSAVLNHYNGFFANVGADYVNTLDNLGLLTSDPLLAACCPGPGSPAIDAGLPDQHFKDPNGTTNDIGACGGPPP